jgi:hypothetical protein
MKSIMACLPRKHTTGRAHAPNKPDRDQDGDNPCSKPCKFFFFIVLRNFPTIIEQTPARLKD